MRSLKFFVLVGLCSVAIPPHLAFCQRQVSYSTQCVAEADPVSASSFDVDPEFAFAETSSPDGYGGTLLAEATSTASASAQHLGGSAHVDSNYYKAYATSMASLDNFVIIHAQGAETGVFQIGLKFDGTGSRGGDGNSTIAFNLSIYGGLNSGGVTGGSYDSTSFPQDGETRENAQTIPIDVVDGSRLNLSETLSLGVATGAGSSADASFGDTFWTQFILPPGVTITSGDGTDFTLPDPDQVPEPASVCLLGLLTAAQTLRRTRRI